MSSARLVMLGAAAAAFAAAAWTAVDPADSGLSLLLAACALIVAQRPGSRQARDRPKSWR